MIRLLTWTDDGDLRFHEFESDEVPAYAILSHTWYTDNKEEVTYEDLEIGSGKQKSGYSKIDFCKKQASVDELAFIWIDTCCINRRSEPELSEAINSMFRWYKNAARCYVYLPDVSTSHEGGDATLRGDRWEVLFLKSRWFTRGWTLQELIAPEHVDFFGRDGTHLGNKSTLETAISNVTGISPAVLRGRSLAECTIEERMTWAKTRTTKREEDHVYSLFGIFDVTMPLVYGEGKAKAFRRLYEEISRYTPVHVDFPAHADSSDAMQELILLRSAMQNLEARLTTSLITRGCGLGLQVSPTLPNIYQSRYDNEERLLAATNTSGYVIESPSSDYRSFLRSLLLKLTQLLSVFAAPLGFFETWSSFRPEEYTIYDIGPQIICYSLALADKHSDVATITHNLLAAKTRRHWIRIAIRITVAEETTHWKVVAEHKPRKDSFVGWRQLPNNITSLVGKVMSDHPDVGDGTEINICFDKSSDATSHDGNPKATSLTRIIDTNVIGNTWSLTESFRHQNVRMIPDATLVTAYLQGIWLLVNLDNRWVAYTTATPGKSGFDHLLRDVNAHIALRDAPYVVQLAGIVMDSENRLKGILIELPSKGPMFRLINAYRLKLKPIPWPVRQKWAKQIVRGIAAHHRRGQVIGGMRTFNWCVCIDKYGNAMVMRYTNGSHPAVHGDNGSFPPEYRTEAFTKGDGQVGPEFDIFQLGMLLWHLYRGQHQQGTKTFCSLMGCKRAEIATCDEHDNPIALPKAAVDVPDYLNEIIALCRQDDPCKRPKAWELVRMFPKDEEIMKQIDLLDVDRDIIPRDRDVIAPNAILRLEVVRDLYADKPLCDICREECRDIYFSCEVCHLGNYDLCSECFVKGEHCLDVAHLLAKSNSKAFRDKGLLKGVSYYSSVNREGKREEIAI